MGCVEPTEVWPSGAWLRSCRLEGAELLHSPIRSVQSSGGDRFPSLGQGSWASSGATKVHVHTGPEEAGWCLNPSCSWYLSSTLQDVPQYLCSPLQNVTLIMYTVLQGMLQYFCTSLPQLSSSLAPYFRHT